MCREVCKLHILCECSPQKTNFKNKIPWGGSSSVRMSRVLETDNPESRERSSFKLIITGMNASFLKIFDRMLNSFQRSSHVVNGLFLIDPIPLIKSETKGSIWDHHLPTSARNREKNPRGSVDFISHAHSTDVSIPQKALMGSFLWQIPWYHLLSGTKCLPQLFHTSFVRRPEACSSIRPIGIKTTMNYLAPNFCELLSLSQRQDLLQ